MIRLGQLVRDPPVEPAMAESVRLAAQVLADTGLALDRPASAWFVPGRIEVLGKHVDYAGGHSLLAATARGFSLVSTPLARPVLRLFDVGRGRRITVDLGPGAELRGASWSSYPATVVRRLARDLPPLEQGLDVAFVNDLPTAAGLSTSSALVVATFLVLAERHRLWNHPAYRRELASLTALAGYLGAVENGYPFSGFAGDQGVGTFGGSEDQTAILCAEPGRLIQVRFCPVVAERTVALPPGRVFAVASSGVAAHKAGGAREDYNRASSLAAAAAAVWRRVTGGSEPHLAAIAQHTGACELGELPARYRAALDAAEATRVEHFLIENEQIVPAAGDALERGDREAFGELVSRSQQCGARLLGNQIPETEGLAELARELGADAASAFGAGFGGSVWALVAEEAVTDFLAAWQARYLEKFPGRAEWARFFATPAAAPARRLAPAGKPHERRSP